MSHISIAVPNSVQFVNIEPTEISPLISKCQIKVCYVGDEPNRNRSIITKETALKMAPSLRGCAIVGYYNNETEDFEEHNRVIDISNGKFDIKDTTKPYGFVNTDAKVWFQKFEDDGVEHEYLMTEGYLWTGQYPECQRVIDHGNNQSMELDENSLDAQWTKDNNGNYKFFIINEAFISKLCILGEDVEPCFEGAQIAKAEFALNSEFKEQLFSLVSQMKELLNEGGTPMFNTYAVEIGDTLWNAVYDYLWVYERKHNNEEEFMIRGIYEEGPQKFVILQDRKTLKLYRLDFSIDEESGFQVHGEPFEVSEQFISTENGESEKFMFSVEDVTAYELEHKQVPAEEPVAEEEPAVEEPVSEEEPIKPVVEEPVAVEEPAAEEEVEDKPEEEEQVGVAEEVSETEPEEVSYNLEEIAEYVELKAAYEQLQSDYSALQESKDAEIASLTAEKENLFNEKNELSNAKSALEEQLSTLNNFKLGVERKEKENMIQNTFYMLDEEYKKDVIENIDKYSLDEIESKLSVICVRNKVNFGLSEESNQGSAAFNLDSIDVEDASVPAWVRAASNTAKNMKI